jgi:hypothetical protein
MFSLSYEVWREVTIEGASGIPDAIRDGEIIEISMSGLACQVKCPSFKLYTCCIPKPIFKTVRNFRTLFTLLQADTF